MESRVTRQPAIQSEKIFTFPKGIPGFEEYTTFRIFHKDDGKISAYWLESCESPTVTFTLVDPTAYDLNYDIYLDDSEQEVIKAENPLHIGVFLMLKKDEQGANGNRISANIGGPLVINVQEQLGLQKVLRRRVAKRNSQEH
ncbi:MAG: flagellar assembly protein FliW [Proteobacteria bacterium]|nr:flagellar assembly protein FliW [Pseudomonadota bacterium]MBU1233130.1 flagellar assembly protein FliW [Pseudomonadota bacterium]MBU1419845.1 flagellar assembly protein FliW [Pseudomonadota bacterium]MBU1454632.1 flagellar assembly protein FliW [Pseudomonadota bacterium]